MLIAKISVHNFRAFGPKGIKLDAEPLNILIGRNGSGKSSLLCALDHSRLHALADAAKRRNDPDATVLAHDAIKNRRASHAAQINIATRLEQYDCDAVVNIANGKRQVNLPPAVPTEEAPATLCRLDRQYAAIRRLPCYPGYTSLMTNVGALPESRIARLNVRMAAVLPQWAEISIDPLGAFNHQGKFQPIESFSVAIRRFLSMQAELLQPEPPPVMLIEHPETGLYPEAMIPLAKTLIAASLTTQLFVTTHSPNLVHLMDQNPSSVVVFEHGDGEPHCCRVHPYAWNLRGVLPGF